MKQIRLLQYYSYIAVFIFSLAFAARLNADDTLHLNSGTHPRVLVELYTSEGCSSCPPAETFLNSLIKHESLWSTYIPVAFHVDYWDYIGWHDPYAHTAHGKRQSQYAKSLGQRTVYTPAFMVNGKPWRKGWFERKLPEQGLLGGALDVEVKGSELSAKYLLLEEGGDELVLHVAVLGMGLSSQITAGENRGRTAQHEFVVVGYQTGLSVSGDWTLELPDLHYAGAEDYALAVWVSDRQNPAPLQAVGGMLPQKAVHFLKKS